ncbi:MAG: MarR family winged helix-turn-helix transcriptional regulator [Amnibacterium sp.]
MNDQQALLRASRAMLAVVARSMGPVLDELSLPQFRVLVLLETAGPARVGLLAERLGVVPSTFSRVLDRLESSGWVARSPSADSRREVLVRITERGSRLVREVSARRQADLDEVLQTIPDADRSRVVEALTVFADAAGEPEAKDLLILGL